MTIITYMRPEWAIGIGRHDGGIEVYIWRLILRFAKDRGAS